MVTVLACIALAAALVCAPGPGGAARAAALWPPQRHGHGRTRRSVAPTLLGGVAGLLLAGPAGALAFALIAAAIRRGQVRNRSARAVEATAGELADAVRRITDELRAGSPPAAALAGLAADGPLARDVLAPAAAAARLGDGVAAALGRRAAESRPEVAADIGRVAAAWSVAERHGIPLADLLARAHEDIRWRVRFGSTVRAQLAGPRATATVLSALPLLGVGLGQLVGADPIGVLRHGVLGQVLLVVGVTLGAAGMAWSRHILHAAVPR